jgi:hypothetical protein
MSCDREVTACSRLRHLGYHLTKSGEYQDAPLQTTLDSTCRITEGLTQRWVHNRSRGSLLQGPARACLLFCHSFHSLTCRRSKQTNSVAFSPRANYTDWANDTCWRHLVPTLVDRGVSRGQRGGSPTVVKLSFPDRSRYFSFSSFILTRTEWIPHADVHTQLFLKQHTNTNDYDINL